MNHRFSLQCGICETAYLIKHQIGYRSTEFFFECPTCGIMLSGKVDIDNTNSSIKSEFSNLEQAKDSNIADFFIQLSGEFYDNKLKKATQSSRLMPGSFLLQSMEVESEKIDKMASLAQYLINTMPEEYKINSNVINLIISPKDNKEYVYSELKKLEIKNYIFEDYPGQEDFIKKYNQYMYSILYSCIYYPFSILVELNEERFDVSITKQNLEVLFYDYPDEVIKLKKEFQPDILGLTTDIIKRIKLYVGLLPKLNPVVTSETFMAHNIEDIKDTKGLNTVDYKNLITNYADTYEVLGKTLFLHVSISNIYLRGNLNNFANNKYKDILQFRNDTIGKQLNYVKENIVESKEYMNLAILNNKIRNAIYHNSIIYESVEQIITFKDRKHTVSLTLIEFANENYKLFFLLIDALFILCSLGNKFNSLDEKGLTTYS